MASSSPEIRSRRPAAEPPLPRTTSRPAPRELPVRHAALQRLLESPLSRMFAVGLGLRILVLTATGRFIFEPDYFGFGYEAGRIASALAAGRGFSDPFGTITGPTAWLAPVYPLILGGIFKVFGTYSPLAGWVTLTFNSICSSFTAVILRITGTDLFGARTGRLAGWVWTLLPYAIFWPIRVIWDTNLTACLLALVLLLTVRLGRAPS
jgi:hypothetical protein